jgi:non-lysosomal glucosylceramidase
MTDYPWLREYVDAFLLKVAMPLGGIGTGTVSLGGRGDLRDWEIMNRPSKGFVPKQGDSWFGAGPSVLLHTCDGTGQRETRLLEGPLDPVQYDGQAGCPVNNHNFPRMKSARFRTAYPLAEIDFACADLPIVVSLQACNPMVPADVEASSLPCALLRYRLRNPTDRPVEASIAFSLPNFIGADRSQSLQNCYAASHDYGPNGNVTEYRDVGDLRGLLLRSEGVARNDPAWGTLALSTTAADCTWRTGWADFFWGDSLLDFWDDLTDDGAVEERTSAKDDPMATLCPRVTVPAAGEAEIRFLLTWHFPNRLAWEAADGYASDACGCDEDSCTPHPDFVGNHYCTLYEDAWDVAVRESSRLDDLEARTVDFVETFLASDVPDVVREAALFNLSTLRTQTCFRTADGRFYGWEGCHDTQGCCRGSCTHVWNYEQGLGFVFGELSRNMRDVEFGLATTERGQVQTRITLPVDRTIERPFLAAADGQLGVIMRFYRDWQLSGSAQLFDEHWPAVRRAIEFCWIEHGWDADRDGVIEGCQHNTMDVEYFGPNPQMGFWYLGALRAGEEMARHAGAHAFADECRRLFDSGRAWMEEHLFNGEYFEHRVVPPGQGATIDPGIIGNADRDDLDDPVLQLGPACLVDQLVGQYMAHVCGLGDLLDPQMARTTLHSIKTHNGRDTFLGHFNHFRSYAVGDERGLLMASYPRGGRPRRPFPYCNELMTGFEYSTAVHMLYAGMEAEGLDCFRAIRERYDGRKRSPFDEAECGHHYARALASWGGLLAWTGFGYSAVTQTLRVGPREGSFFFSTGDAWGRYELTARTLHLELRGGRLQIERLSIDADPRDVDATTLHPGESLDISR